THTSRLVLAGLLLAVGCGSSGSSPTGSGGSAATGGSPASGGSAGSIATGGASGTGGSAAAGAPGACAPTVPAIVWTNPYAGWSRGIPTAGDPTFFPIAVWLQGSWHATEMAKLGINVYVGNNADTDALAASDLATLKAQGIYAIVGQDSVGLANIDDPTIVGWWMTPDEPDNAQDKPDGGCCDPPVAPATLVTRYNAYQAADSTRPIYVGLGQGVAYDGWEGRGSNAPAESGYMPAGDIVDFDIYPYNNCDGDPNEMATCGQFWLNAYGIDRIHQWSTRGQAAWTDIECTTIAAGGTHPPTPQQTKSEVWLTLIHGANGIAYFVDTWNPSFREDGIFADSTMTAAVTALNQQIKMLAPQLNSANIPNLVSVASSNSAAPIDLMVKAKGQTLYVFAAISRAGTATGSFTVAGMTGGATATVVGESRTVTVAAGKFSDTFAANDAHVYQIDLTAATCP
ncbi:MAG TPA: hypothetical protein VI456_01485, partial [Polyangia bacterium]